MTSIESGTDPLPAAGPPPANESAADQIRRPGVRILDPVATMMVQIADLITALALVGMLLTTLIGILARYVAHFSVAWTAEMSGNLFVVLTFAGAVSGLGRGVLPRMDVLESHLPGNGARLVRGLAHGISLFFLAVLADLSLAAALDMRHVSWVTLPISQLWVYLVLPLAVAAMAVITIRDIISADLRGIGYSALATSLAASGGVHSALALEGNPLYLFVFAILILGLGLGMPVAFAIGTAGLLMISTGGIPESIVPERLFGGANSVVLIAIPLFMLTGVLMSDGGMATRLIDFMQALFGRARGGLGMANVGASLVFADVSSSAVADTAALGRVMIPEMAKRGYPKPFSAGLQSAAGSLGLMCPPSSTMIVYAVVASVSVSDVFLHSFLPGIMVAGSFAALTYLIARRRGFPRGEKASAREVAIAGKRSLLALLTPVLILGCIFGGVTTVNEAGAMATVYALVVSLFVYRSFKPRQLLGLTRDAAVTSANVTLIISTAFLLSFALASFRGPQAISEALGGISTNPIVVLLMLNLALVVLHMVLEGIATVLIVVPVILPLLDASGVDPVLFGVILAQNTALGLLFPPLGLNLYVAAGIAKIPVIQVAKAVLPFCAVLVLDILLLIFFPQIATLVPSLLG